MINAPVVIGTSYTNGHWAKRPLYGVICGLLAMIVVDDGPRGPGPAVIELPDEGPTTEAIVAPLTTPILISKFHGF